MRRTRDCFTWKTVLRTCFRAGAFAQIKSPIAARWFGEEMDERIERARELIENREQDDSNLSAAENLLLELAPSNAPDAAMAYGLLGEVQYWRGQISEGSNQELVSIYDKGVEYCKKGEQINPDNIDSVFWLAVNRGFYGEANGILSSLFLIDPIENGFKKALEIDETYYFGGPHRGIGWFYHKLPSWPISHGDNRKAIHHLEKSLSFGPNFYLTHIYLAQVFLAVRDKAKAREHLEWIQNAPLTANHEKEDQRYKEQAMILSKKV